MIWVFGDSFSVYFKFLQDSWVHSTALTLNHEVKNFARILTSLEYTYCKFHQTKKQIEKNDIVIVSLTTILERRWHSMPGKKLDKDELYFNHQYSDQDNERKNYLIEFLDNLHNTTKKKDLHTIVLMNFHDIEEWILPIMNNYPLLNFAKGVMVNISENEFTDAFHETHGMSWIIGKDVRANHITKTNHTVMTNKIIDNIKNKTSIDLTNGFKEKFVDEKLLEDTDFIKEELFEGFISKVFNIHINRPL